MLITSDFNVICGHAHLHLASAGFCDHVTCQISWWLSLEVITKSHSSCHEVFSKLLYSEVYGCSEDNVSFVCIAQDFFSILISSLDGLCSHANLSYAVFKRGEIKSY